MNDLLDLSGKVAIITGASSGMGRAMAELFAEHGAEVIAMARRKELLDELAAKHSNITPFVGDVTSAQDIENIVAGTLHTHNAIDILINNAGIMDEMTPVADLTDDLWDRVFSVNVTGVMRMSRAVLKTMITQQSGAIVNIASISGLRSGRAGAAYTASKHAVIGLSENIAFTYAEKGIRCNVICPGAVKTEISKTMSHPNPFGLERAMSGTSNNPRVGSSDEVARLALFLASPAASLINGSTVVADSGWLAY